MKKLATLALLLASIAANASPVNENSPLGINLAEPVRYNTDRPFIDEMKRAEVVPTRSNGSINRAALPYVDFDRAGWPRSLTPTDAASPAFEQVTYILFGGDYDSWDQAAPAGGEYKVFYEGEGTITYGYGAVKTGSCGTTCDTVQITPANGLAYVSITATDPANTGNYLRNIQVIAPGGICGGDIFTTHANAAECPETFQSFASLRHTMIFNPDYLRDLRPYRSLRFMDYMHTNKLPITDASDFEALRNMPLIEWADRSHPGDAQWVSDERNGMPVETMTSLANTLEADPWFTLPVHASDDYITQFAQAVKTELAADRKVYIEYGNEIWNGGFITGTWVNIKGIDQWYRNSDGSAYTAAQIHAMDGGQRWQARLNWFGKRTQEMCSLWKTAWGDDAGRVVCVVGAQAADTSALKTSILACPLWTNDSSNPFLGRDCSKGVDAFAIAPYFGGYIASPNNAATLANWASEGDAGMDRLFQELTSGGLLPSTKTGGALTEAKDWVTKASSFASSTGLSLLGYEAGQHLVGVSGVENNNAITAFLRDANRDPRMGALYAQYLNNWKNTANTETLAMFSSISYSSKWGSWGLKEFQQEHGAPKHLATWNFISNNACWWDGCGTTLPDIDYDFDGVPDRTDNCLLVPNPDQADSNNNLVGDSCESQTLAPQAIIATSVSSGTVPFTVNFDGSASYDADGSISHYQWDFGGLDTAAGANTSFTFTTPGNWEVVLGVTDAQGNIGTNSVFITANGQAPVAVINATPTLGTAPLSVHFDATGSTDNDGSISTYTWDFGDGQSATGAIVDHVYDSAGSFTATLTVKDNSGEETVTSLSISAFSANGDGGEFTVSASQNMGGGWTNGASTLNFSRWNHGFLQFPLADVTGALESATLRLYSNQSGPIQTYAWAADSDDLNESSGAQPKSIGYSGSASPITSTIHNQGYFELDVSAYIASQLSGDMLATFELTTDQDGWKQFDSRLGANPPELVIVTQTASGGNISPVANFTGSSGSNTFSFDFDASTSRDEDGSIATWQWSFGDGADGEGQSVSHTYEQAGNYTVRLTVSDDRGATHAIEKTVTATAPTPINNPPAAVITAPASIIAGVTAQFSGSNSSDTDGGIVSYSWQFGDGATATGSAASHAYGSAGNVTVSLTVTDEMGATDTAEINITVNEAPNVAPVAEFSASPSPAVTGQSLVVDASASSDSDGSIAAYVWDFGDGSSAGGVSSSHSYSSAGSFTIRLTVTDDKGTQASTSRTVNVELPANVAPVARLTTSSQAAYIGDSITFNATQSTDSDGTIASYSWDFGDGDSASGNSVNHSYSAAGTPEVVLTVTDDRGDSHSATLVLTITEKPNTLPSARFSASTSASVTSQVVQFDASASNDPDGNIRSYQWSFGDGTSATGVTANHSWLQAGTFPVTLTVTDNKDGIGSSSQNIVVTEAVNQVPTASFLATPSAVSTGDLVDFDASSSVDSDGTITSWLWDFGDSQTASGEHVQHSYQVAGAYTATLTVTDNKGASATAGKSITVSAATQPGGTHTLNPGDDIGASKVGTREPLSMSYWDHAFFRFPLHSISGTVQSAKLRLNSLQSRSMTTSVWAAVSDSWSESTGAPAKISGATALGKVAHSANGYIEIDVTHFVTAQLAGDKVASFEIGNDQSGWQNFTSRDGANKPQLVIVTTGSAANTAPSAAFSQISSGLAVSFDASASTDADGNIQSYTWQFGDGTSGTGKTVQHSYAAEGNYTVSLKVVDNNGAPASINKQVAVSTNDGGTETPENVAPVAVISASSTTITAGGAVTFSANGSSDSDGSIVGYQWQFGSEGGANGNTASHTFNTAGNVTVTLTVTDDDGATHSAGTTIGVTQPVANVLPAAYALATPDNVTIGDTVQFDGAASTDSDGSITAWHWDFGDGNTANGATPQHVYSVAGEYSVNLTVTDNSGGQAVDQTAVTVSAPDNGGSSGGEFTLTPVADIGSSKNGSREPLNMSLWDHAFFKFDMSGLSGTVSSAVLQIYAVDSRAIDIYAYGAGSDNFSETSAPPAKVGQPGDNKHLDKRSITSGGWVSLDVTPFVAVQLAGDKVASFELANNQGGWERFGSRSGANAAKLVITTNGGVAVANKAPTASFTAVTGASSLQQKMFDASNSADSDGSITSYQWTFGNGVSATGKSATHQYASAGSYTVRLTVTDNQGATASSAKVIAVEADSEPNIAPVARFSATPAAVSVGDAVLLDASNSSDVDGGISSYLWDNGDGTTSTLAVFQHSYSTAGAYTIKLTVTDDAGASSTATKTVNVAALNTGGSGTTTINASDDIGASGQANAEPLRLSQWDHAFLKFPLAAADATITSAKLRLYQQETISIKTTVWAAVTDNWSESTKAPAKAAGSGATQLGSVTTSKAEYIEIDVTAFVRTQRAGDGVASFEVTNDNGGWKRYGSRHGTHPPQLVINAE